MKQFFIIVNKKKDKNLNYTSYIAEYLKNKGAVCHIYRDYAKKATKPIKVPDGTECILAIGGDGTILHAAGMLVGCGIPLLGINLGTLGFLADINQNEIEHTLDCLIRDEYQIEERMMIQARVIRDGECINRYLALNDFVLKRRSYTGMLWLSVMINDVEIQSYQADGMVVATPTGSTGYNLSAGGPIINPTSKSYVCTPICPHTLTGRSVVLAKTDTISIELKPVRVYDPGDGILLYDGKEGMQLQPGDQIQICKTEEVTPFIKMKEISFVKVLKEKLY